MRPSCRSSWSEDNRGVAERRPPAVPGRFDLKLWTGLMLQSPVQEGGACPVPRPGEPPGRELSAVSLANTGELNILKLPGAFHGAATKP